MDGQRWQRVKEIFSAALDRDAALRPAYLDEACGADAELRAEVDSLLAAHSDTEDSAIDRPAARGALNLSGALGAEPEPVNWIGRRVGDYRIVEEVGRGGMSEVYRGVRDDDEYHKDVAVKVLRSGYDTRALLKRFKVETQILATLDHPNIARLLDAGSTPEGLPYLVMDYIKGVPIDEYCRRNKLGLNERLALFRKLCGAVQYVHQHLMVHGDLKCSNVIVSEQGAVKLLDFGIARLLSPATAPTGVPEAKRTAFVAMTPEYASPEQIRGGAITTSSDVYSLGVMLYQLVTGVLPYRIRGDFSFELASEIVQREAIPPSTAAKTNETEENTGFGRQLRGDLDNIILMALEKEPARRYSSVEKFEEDIRRHLEGFPVAARSAGYLYQIGKFAGRHKALLAATGLVLVTLIGGIVTTMRQAEIAWDERQRAQRHFDEVRKLANVFMFDVHTAIQDLPGATAARKMLVENSLVYLETLSKESANEPSLQRELASAYEKVADVQGGFRSANLGDVEGAIRSYRKAIAIRQALIAAMPTDRSLQSELMRNYGKLSGTLETSGDAQGSIEAARGAAGIAGRLAASPEATPTDFRNQATANVSLGSQLAVTGQLGDGVLLMRQGVAAYEKLLDAAPEDPIIRRLLAIAYGRIGHTLVGSALQYEEGLRVHQKGYALARKLSDADPHNVDLQKIIAYALLDMGYALVQIDRSQEGLAKYQEATTILRKMLDADPNNDLARYDVALVLGLVGEAYIELHQPQVAEPYLTQALALLSKTTLLAAPGDNDGKVLLGFNYFRLGQANLQRARCSDAQRWFELSKPLLSRAALNPEWQAVSKGKAEVIPQLLSACKPEIASTH